MPHARPRFFVTSLMPILAAGCLGGTMRFYTLSSTAGAPLAPHHLRVGLGPVGVPAYLEPPALATRVDANRLQYASLDRWASPLSAQVTRALAQDLGASGTMLVVQYPWYPSTSIDVVVRVTLLAFESDASGVAHLDAEWSVLEPRTGVVRKSDRTTLTEPADGRTSEAAVAALSRALAELARRISDALPAARSAS